jgi:hypothetical protein
VNRAVRGAATYESPQLTRIEELLGRYPDITESEVEEVADFLTKGPHTEVGRLSAKDSIRTKMALFRDDHKKRFALGFRDYLIVAAIVLFVVVVGWLLLDSGKAGAG